MKRGWIAIAALWLSVSCSGTGTPARASAAAGADSRGPQAVTRTYSVKITTRNCRDAGTDANVRLMFCGFDDRGLERCTPEYLLDNSGCNDFEQGREDSFTLLSRIHFQRLTAINIRRDDAGNKPGWLPGEVVIAGPDGRSWRFCINRWLAEDECDGRVDITFRTDAPCSHPACPLPCTSNRQSAGCRAKTALWPL